MSGGDSGGGSNSSRPLTAAERSELFDASMSKMGGSIPTTNDYQGYQIIDPSADRGRGVQSNGLNGYSGYSNIAPRTLKDNSGDFYNMLTTAADRNSQLTSDSVMQYLDDYFAKRDAAARDLATQQQGG